MFKTKMNNFAKSASAGNRTRIYCLEGNNANLYTTDAVQTGENSRGSIAMILEITILNFNSIFHKTECVSRESNPDLLLGRQQC